MRPAHHALVDLNTRDGRVGQRLCKLERRPARAAAQLEQRRAVAQPVAPHVPQLCEGRLQLRGECLPACLSAPEAWVRSVQPLGSMRVPLTSLWKDSLICASSRRISASRLPMISVALYEEVASSSSASGWARRPSGSYASNVGMSKIP